MKPKTSLFHQLLDFVLPPLCISCRTVVSDHHSLCASCWSNVSFIQRPICDQLGFSLPFDEGGKIVSATAIAMKPKFDHARSVAHYNGVMRELIHRFKYYGQMEGKHIFAQWMAMAAQEFIDEADLIIAVPLYSTKLFTRRFNQASVLADGLGSLTDLPVNHFILKRVKNTRQQVGLSANARKKNVAGAFEVVPEDHIFLKDKNILLIDDVFTTGSTANACARILKQAGANQVDLITLARVNEPINPVL